LALQPDSRYVDVAESLACWFAIVITQADDVNVNTLGRQCFRCSARPRVCRIVREEQDRGVSAAQPASFQGCKLIVFAKAGFGGTNSDDVRSDLLRKSMPVFARIPGFDVIEKFAV